MLSLHAPVKSYDGYLSNFDPIKMGFRWSFQFPVPVAVSAVVQPDHRPGIDSESLVPLEFLTSIELYMH